MKIYQPLYDRIKIPSKATCVKFFQTPIGGSHDSIQLAGNKTHSNSNIATPLDTNMNMSGELHQRNYAIEGISFTSDILDDQEDVFNVLKRCWAQLTIDGINYLQLPAQFVYQDPDDFDINDPAYVWDEPVKLYAGSKFYSGLLNPKPVNIGRFDIYCVLHGYFFTEKADCEKAECEKPVCETEKDSK